VRRSARPADSAMLAKLEATHTAAAGAMAACWRLGALRRLSEPMRSDRSL
jgi:hypothetical protein